MKDLLTKVEYARAWVVSNVPSFLPVRAVGWRVEVAYTSTCTLPPRVATKYQYHEYPIIAYAVCAMVVPHNVIYHVSVIRVYTGSSTGTW